MNLSTKILGMLVISLLIISIVLTSVSIRSLKISGQNEIKRISNQMMAEKKNMLKNVVLIAKHIADSNITNEQAIKLIKEIRYGPIDKDYFWINSTDKPYPKMVMHPIAPQLDGKVLDNPKYNCAMDKSQNLFAAAVEVAESSIHGGFVPYKYPKPGQNKDTLFPKLSAVMKIPNRNWVIGTGIYIDDIDATVATIEKNISKNTKSQIMILLTLALVLTAISIIIAFFSIKKAFGPVNEIVWALRELAVGKGDLTKSLPLKSLTCSSIKNCGKTDCVSYGRDNYCWIESGSLSSNIDSLFLLNGTYKTCRECKDVYLKCVSGEISQLASYFNGFLSKFRSIFKTIMDDINVLSTTADQFNSLSDDVKKMITGTLEKTQSSSQEISSLASDTSLVSEAMDESANTMSSVSESSEDLKNSITNIETSSETAQRVVKQAVERAEKATEIIKNLGQEANGIGTVRHKIKIKSPILNQDNMGYQQPIFQVHWYE